MTNSTTPSNKFHLFIQSNSPGELSRWVAPLAKRIKKQHPNTHITLFLAPCQYASGNEEKVAQNISSLDEIITVKDTLKHCFLFKKIHKKSAKGAILYCGGDPLYAQLWRCRTGFPAYAYTEHNTSLGPLFKHVFTKDKDGDLMATQIQDTVFDHEKIRTKHALKNTDYCLFLPGSRPQHFNAFLPICIQTIHQIQTKDPTFSSIIGLSPYIQKTDLTPLLNQYPLPPHCHLIQSDSLELMSIATLMVSLPGTNTAEGMYMHCPMLTVAPLNHPELIILDGLAGLIEKLPGIGPWIKLKAVHHTVNKTDYISHPNILTQSVISPQIKACIEPQSFAHEILTLFQDKKQCDDIKKALKNAYTTSAVADCIIETIFNT